MLKHRNVMVNGSVVMYIFLELFPFVSVCLCERHMLKIQYLLQIYNKKIVKTNQGNEMMI